MLYEIISYSIPLGSYDDVTCQLEVEVVESCGRAFNRCLSTSAGFARCAKLNVELDATLL